MILTRHNALTVRMRHNGVLKDLQSMGKARPEGIFKDIQIQAEPKMTSIIRLLSE